MPRSRRLDYRGAYHYVRIRGREGSCIYFDAVQLDRSANGARDNAPRVRRFEQLLDEACEECGAALQAYCVEPNVATLLLRTAGAPLQECMLRLRSQYSRYLRAEVPPPRYLKPFAGRYESKLLAPEYMLYAVRRLHERPVSAGLCRRVTDYPFSSAQVYLGECPHVVLDLGAVGAALERRGFRGWRGYRKFMEQGENHFMAKLFERGAELDSRIVGSNSFVVQAQRRAALPRATASREQLIVAVMRLIGIAPEELYSATPAGVLGRSLVAWYGVREGAASMKEMGTWFAVSGPALGHAIRHYRRTQPELFNRRLLSETEY